MLIIDFERLRSGRALFASAKKSPSPASARPWAVSGRSRDHFEQHRESATRALVEFAQNNKELKHGYEFCTAEEMLILVLACISTMNALLASNIEKLVRYIHLFDFSLALDQFVTMLIAGKVGETNNQGIVLPNFSQSTVVQPSFSSKMSELLPLLWQLQLLAQVQQQRLPSLHSSRPRAHPSNHPRSATFASTLVACNTQSSRTLPPTFHHLQVG
jgi:hypothetical protein